MRTDEIVKLTRQAVLDLIHAQQEAAGEPLPGHEGRRSPRWPFPGTVEIQSTDGEAGQWFATCRNISETGLGMCADRYFDPETILDIAVHQPEASLYGRAIVRYCQQTPNGFMTGVEFDFED